VKYSVRRFVQHDAEQVHLVKQRGGASQFLLIRFTVHGHKEDGIHIWRERQHVVAREHRGHIQKHQSGGIPRLHLADEAHHAGRGQHLRRVGDGRVAGQHHQAIDALGVEQDLGHRCFLDEIVADTGNLCRGEVAMDLWPLQVEIREQDRLVDLARDADREVDGVSVLPQPSVGLVMASERQLFARMR
jgi:hypothetical protein